MHWRNDCVHFSVTISHRHCTEAGRTQLAASEVQKPNDQRSLRRRRHRWGVRRISLPLMLRCALCSVLSPFSPFPLIWTEYLDHRRVYRASEGTFFAIGEGNLIRRRRRRQLWRGSKGSPSSACASRSLWPVSEKQNACNVSSALCVCVQGHHVRRMYRLGEVSFKCSCSMPGQCGSWSVNPPSSGILEEDLSQPIYSTNIATLYRGGPCRHLLLLTSM